MTSTAVHTISLTVPSTQNTAPVFDFRCLYTHDLRRKAKRWQDGILRFHTFNKRVMVYDILRNFIGDTHWRERGPLQDGDDVELEKGVLVQVGESTGSTDQDLSDLFKNRINAQGVSPGKAPPPSSSPAKSIPVPPSQLRPRTLNSLLGTSRGPLGRAAVPSRSPYQVRREIELAPIDVQRHTKRQRIKTRTVENVTRRHGDLALPQKITAPIQEPMDKPIRTACNQDSTVTNGHANSANSSSNSCLRVSKESTDLRSSSSTRAEQVAPDILKRQAKEQKRPRELNDEPENQLQIIARKPRKKLMCTNLIPQKTFSTRQMSKTNELGAQIKERKRRADDYQTKSQEAQHDRRKARSKEPSEKQIQPYIPNDAESPYLIDSDDFSDSNELPRTDSPNIKSTTNPHAQNPNSVPTKPPPQNPRTTLTVPSPPTLFPLPPLLPRATGPLNRSISLPESSTQRRNRAFAHHAASGHQLGSEKELGGSEKAQSDISLPARGDQGPDPWSREAWDLFGYERPGQMVGD